jgi:hypothetical protein
MIPTDMKDRMMLELFFMISALIMGAVLILFFIPNARFQVDAFWNSAFKIFWWVCGIITLFLSKETKGNLVGSFMCVIFGPISLSTLVFYYLYLKRKFPFISIWK